jgi:UPF0271 protein
MSISHRDAGTRLTVDLNSDLGEGFGVWTLGDDDALLEVVTSANVACGFHAGDPSIMRRVCERAAKQGVSVGAQVSYRDLAGFGRRAMDVDATTLADDVLYQLGALAAFCNAAGTAVKYLKPHGALYHRSVRDDTQARAVVAAVTRFNPALPVLGLAGSALLGCAAEAGLPTITEAFVDRAYLPSGELIPRGEPGAVLDDPNIIASRSVQLVLDSMVTASDGTAIAVNADSLCVHGDTPGAVEIARTVRRALEQAGVTIAAFA